MARAIRAASLCYFNAASTLAIPATAHTSSFSPPGAPETPMVRIHPRALRQFGAAMQR
jgi:hypothetical protein